MKNVKENKRRWKQLVAIFIVAVMLFTTPHIVGFASMGKEEATTSSAKPEPIVKEYKSDEVNVTVTAADKNDLPEDAE